MLIAAATFVLIVMGLNFDFYRFFAARHGVWFALRVVPLRWLYFYYCGLSVALGTLSHFLSEAQSGKWRMGNREGRSTRA